MPVEFVSKADWVQVENNLYREFVNAIVSGSIDKWAARKNLAQLLSLVRDGLIGLHGNVQVWLPREKAGRQHPKLRPTEGDRIILRGLGVKWE